jgi:NAD(P)-dependent dehydrogenase (short-subunit alcohol dehydrogenase family)
MASAAPSRVVVLTGATKGLGEALVAELAARGHRVVGCGRTASAVAALSSRYPGPAHRFDVVDVSSDASVAQWATSVLASHGAPDILVNNAAAMNDRAPLWEVSAEEFDAVVDANVKGVANVCRRFIPAMLEGAGAGAGGGAGAGAGAGAASAASPPSIRVVVNFSSYWGRSTSSGVAPYCATKWGVEGLTSALAQDLDGATRAAGAKGKAKGQGQAGAARAPSRVVAVALNPGIIHTEMLAKCFGEDGASGYPDAATWAKAAAPYILGFSAKDNGASVTVPGF